MERCPFRWSLPAEALTCGLLESGCNMYCQDCQLDSVCQSWQCLRARAAAALPLHGYALALKWLAGTAVARVERPTVDAGSTLLSKSAHHNWL